jgi:hypothetical protein
MGERLQWRRGVHTEHFQEWSAGSGAGWFRVNWTAPSLGANDPGKDWSWSYGRGDGPSLKRGHASSKEEAMARCQSVSDSVGHSDAHPIHVPPKPQKIFKNSAERTPRMSEVFGIARDPSDIG